jgi:hypothetical protein
MPDNIPFGLAKTPGEEGYKPPPRPARASLPATPPTRNDKRPGGVTQMSNSHALNMLDVMPDSVWYRPNPAPELPAPNSDEAGK